MVYEYQNQMKSDQVSRLV